MIKQMCECCNKKDCHYYRLAMYITDVWDRCNLHGYDMKYPLFAPNEEKVLSSAVRSAGGRSRRSGRWFGSLRLKGGRDEIHQRRNKPV